MVIRDKQGKLRYPATLLCLDGSRHLIDLPWPVRSIVLPAMGKVRLTEKGPQPVQVPATTFKRRPFCDSDGRKIFDEVAQ